MKLLSNLFLIVLFAFLYIGCDSNSNQNKQQVRICPQCNMKLPDTNIHTADMKYDDKIVYFDDIGCMILWAKKEKIDLKKTETRIFSNDTKKYINPFTASFAINAKTPMMYGFSAYENECNGCIKFEEVIMKMLRGEHMANPKIRKQILGYYK